jgi:AI-2 transport protein TqsA
MCVASSSVCRDHVPGRRPAACWTAPVPTCILAIDVSTDLSNTTSATDPVPNPDQPQPDVAGPQERSTATPAIRRDALQVIALGLLVCVLAYLIARELASILRPLMVAVFIGYLISPVHRWLVRRRLPSLLSYLVIVAGFVLISFTLGSVVARNASALGRDLPGYITGLRQEFQRQTKMIEHALQRWRVPHGEVGRATATTPTATPATGELGGAAATLPAQENAAPPAAAAWSPWEDWVSPPQLAFFVRNLLEGLLSLFSNAAVVGFYLFFLLAERAGLPRRLAYAFGPQRAGEILATTANINAAIGRYVAIKTFTSAVTGLLTTALLWLFGVNYALMWGLLAFVANFVPYLGALVAVLLPVAMGLVQFGFVWQPLTIGILLTLLQMVVGNFVEPRLLGRGLGISPLLVVLALAFWGLVWGIPGMILSTPLTVVLKIVLENMPATRPLARLFSDAPARAVT